MRGRYYCCNVKSKLGNSFNPLVFILFESWSLVCLCEFEPAPLRLWAVSGSQYNIHVVSLLPASRPFLVPTTA